MLKKKLKTGSVVEAWNYDTGIYTGMSIGAYDKMTCNSKATHDIIYNKEG